MDAIKVALITGAVTAAGWFITRILDSVNSRRNKRSEIRQQHVQKQIEEFYGPLFSLVWQVFNNNHLQYRILSSDRLDRDQQGRVKEYFANICFKPIHEEIRQILKSKLYLVEGAEMPLCFYDYLQHSLQEIIQHDLWSLQQIDTSFVAGLPFPQPFFDEIERSLKRLMAEYESKVDALRPDNINELSPPRSA